MANKLEEFIPVVRYSGIISDKDVDFSGSSSVLLPSGTTIGGASLTALGTISSTSANALAVGANGATNPGFNVDASTSSSATGINVKSAAATAGVAVTVLSSGTNESMTLNAKGSGTVSINATATGGITLGRATTITTGDLTVTNGSIVVSANAKGLTFTGTGTNGGLLTNLYNQAAGTLSGTQLTIKIMIGATPYYFLVSPTVT